MDVPGTFDKFSGQESGDFRLYKKLQARSNSFWPVVPCAPEGIRTPNLLIRSQMLYPLSYGRMGTTIQLCGGGERI